MSVVLPRLYALCHAHFESATDVIPDERIGCAAAPVRSATRSFWLIINRKTTAPPSGDTHLGGSSRRATGVRDGSAGATVVPSILGPAESTRNVDGTLTAGLTPWRRVLSRVRLPHFA
jgi:hypothetical protein